MVCRYCHIEDADEDTGYCSAECMAKDLEERTAVCSECGKTYIKPRKLMKGNICGKCWYDKRISSTRRRAKKAPERTGMTIDEAMRIQEQVRRETGRHISYGEIIAGKMRNGN